MSRHPGAELWWLDDDVELCALVAPQLIASGWRVRTFHKPELLHDALQQSRPDLLILDQRLKGQDGSELLNNLRQRGEQFPVLILSALGTPADRISGLERGAQDYMVKPFHPRELQLRCERLLQSERRNPVVPLPAEAHIMLGNLSFSPHEGMLGIPGKASVMLTRGERVLLLALCRAPGRVMSRDDLAVATQSLVSTSSSRSIDVRLSRLRRILMSLSGGAVHIESIRSQGYALTVVESSNSRSDGCEP